LWVLMKAAILESGAAVDQRKLRWSYFRVSSANQRLTSLIHHAEVGVKWMCQCGLRASHALTFGVF